MNILSAFIVFDILIIFYELLIEIFSALYEISGLTKEQARFQVTSILTGTGFTTTESEKMLATKKRKRVTRDIMIISYIFNISIISTLVTLLTSTKDSTLYELLIGLLISVFVLLLLFFSRRVRKIRNAIDKAMLNIANSIFYKKQNQIIVYDYYDKNALVEVKLKKVPENIKNKTLSEIKLRDKYNIKLLFIKRKNRVITDLKENIRLNNKDIILLIGNKKVIDKIFKNYIV